MSVTNQVWFIDIPLVEDNPRDLSELVIGFPFPAPALINDYLRRYLNDVSDETYPLIQGSGADLDTEVDGPDNFYLRRYLNDDINNVPPPTTVGPEVDVDTEVDGPDNKYMRRYLNDLINEKPEE